MQLYKHQSDIVVEDKPKTGLWLGTGSGKTRIALELARGKTLIICPKTQKEDRNWERELQKIGGYILPLIKKINENKVHVGGLNDCFLTTISKETFRRDNETLPAFDTVIVDEAHTCLGVTPNTRQRNKRMVPKASQLFEALDAYLKRTNPARLYLVTATIMKSPMTVWGAATILGEDWNFYEFRQAFYFRLPMPGREVWTPKNDDETKDRLARAARKLGYTGRLEDYFDVPEQTYKTVYIELGEAQKKRIKDMAIEYPEPITRVGKIHQIENGVLSGDEFKAPESFENRKIDAILDFAIEFPRMVIFAKYTAQIEAIEQALKDKGYKVLTMTGETKERGKVIKEVSESAACIFIVQAQISAGWELTGPTKENPHYYNYSCMIFASRNYSFVDYDQAVGRIQRSSNIKKNLYINLVVKGGTDEAVDDCLVNKRDFNERIYINL